MSRPPACVDKPPVTLPPAKDTAPREETKSITLPAPKTAEQPLAICSPPSTCQPTCKEVTTCSSKDDCRPFLKAEPNQMPLPGKTMTTDQKPTPVQTIVVAPVFTKKDDKPA